MKKQETNLYIFVNHGSQIYRMSIAVQKTIWLRRFFQSLGMIVVVFLVNDNR